MKLTLFSVEETNQMLSEIRPAIERLVQAKRDFDRLERRADVLSLAASGAVEGNPDAEELRRVLESRKVLGERIRKGIEAIHGRGPLVKDLDRGLIDFYSISGDRLIFLCWQLGENEIEHWHSLEGGFGNRQPLNRTELE